MKPNNTPFLIALFFTLVSAFWLISVRAAPQSAALRLPQADNPAPPAAPVRLVFVHHSTGGNWLADVGEHESAGGLGRALMNNNYYVSATNYGWTVDGDSIGDRTDLGHWWEWFNGPTRDAILAALYAENEQNFGDFGAWPRLASAPGGENKIIIFKSCFPNSHLSGNPSDPPTVGNNPLRGQDAWSEYMTVGNAKRIYVDLLTYFATRQDKLFIVITAPPLLEDDVYQPTDPAHAANARALNQWLVNDWLDGYPHPNVAVFDFYHVLTSNGGDPTTNDLDTETGNHHRWWNGAVQHIQGVSGDFSAYALWQDSHPTSAGGQKATGEFVPLLNVFYHRWADGGGTPVPTLTPTATPPNPDDAPLFLPLVLRGSAAPPAAPLWVTDDSVRLDPVTGSLIEERHSAGVLGPAYHTTNPVWDGQTVRLMAARNEIVAFQVMVEGGPHTGVALSVSDLTGPTTLPAADHVVCMQKMSVAP